MDVSAFLSSPIGIVVLAGLGFVVGKFAFKGDSRLEDRRRKAIDVSAKLSSLGLTRLPNLLREYAVGNYSGMASQLGELYQMLSDPLQRRAEFKRVLDALLKEYMQDDETRPAILKLVDDLRNAHDPGFTPGEVVKAVAADVSGDAEDVARKVADKVIEKLPEPVAKAINDAAPALPAGVEDVAKKVADKVIEKLPEPVATAAAAGVAVAQNVVKGGK